MRHPPFDIVPGKTIDIRGKKMINIQKTGLENGHVIVVLSCMASGEFLPSMFIFKEK